MSFGVNKVILVGRLGADPEVRSTSTGQRVCSLNLATNESWVKDGKKEERTEWHRVILWARQAEFAEKFLKKGRSIYVEGRLQTRSWQDAQGQKRYTTEIVANNIQFVDSANSNSNLNSNYDSPSSQRDPFEFSGSDMQTDTFGTSPAATSSSENKMGRGHSFDDDIPF